MNILKIRFPKNLNGKLNCEKFIHIDDAPKNPVTREMRESTVIEIHVDDQSTGPTQWLIEDVQVLPLEALGSANTWASHGLDLADFWKQEREKGRTGFTLLAVYFYKRYTP